MKKFMLMLLCVAATTNVMAVSFTYKATVILTSTSGYTCDMTLAESPEYSSSLNGSEMNMESRKIALYVVRNTDTLQVAQTSSFEGVRVGLKTDATTHYTISVSSVIGTETLYLYDANTGTYFALDGTSTYEFDATANSVNSSRFTLTKTVPTPVTPTVFTAMANLTLTSESGYNCNLTIAESAEYGDLMGSEMNMEGRKVALYVLNGTDTLQVVRAADLSGAIIGIKTDVSENYNIAFSSVEGSLLYLYDSKTGISHEIVGGESFDFTATASSIDGDRFLITKTPIATGPLKVCFNNDVVEIYENPYGTPIIIRNALGAAVLERPAGSTPIELTSLEPGTYTVEFNNGTRKFIIEKK